VTQQKKCAYCREHAKWRIEHQDGTLAFVCNHADCMYSAKLWREKVKRFRSELGWTLDGVEVRRDDVCS
jgi:hypothetical protein